VESRKPAKPLELHDSIRTLKIEADGDTWKGSIKPKIRLMGCWLERAGFKPSDRVIISYVAPGVLELRYLGPVLVDGKGESTPDRTMGPL